MRDLHLWRSGQFCYFQCWGERNGNTLYWIFPCPNNLTNLSNLKSNSKKLHKSGRTGEWVRVYFSEQFEHHELISGGRTWSAGDSLCQVRSSCRHSLQLSQQIDLIISTSNITFLHHSLPDPRCEMLYLLDLAGQVKINGSSGILSTGDSALTSVLSIPFWNSLIFLCWRVSSSGGAPGWRWTLDWRPMRGWEEIVDICQWRSYNENINCKHKIRAHLPTTSQTKLQTGVSGHLSRPNN